MFELKFNLKLIKLVFSYILIFIKKKREKFLAHLVQNSLPEK